MKIPHDPFTRAIAIVTGTSVLVSAVTYAAIQGQVVLADSSITTVTADLRISRNGVSYGASRGGFDFTDLIPGSDPSPITGHPFYLRNNGNSPLRLSVAVLPTPSISITPSGTADTSKIKIIFERTGGAGSQEFSLQELISASSTGGLDLSEVLQIPDDNVLYTAKVRIEPNAFSGTSASLSDVDIVFFGTPVTST